MSAASDALDVAAGKAEAADDLKAFLQGGQLEHYYEAFVAEGITRVSHLKDIEQENYSHIGLKSIEIRRLERIYQKWKKENKKSLSVRLKEKIPKRKSAHDLQRVGSSAKVAEPAPAAASKEPPSGNVSPVCLIQLQYLTILKQLGKGSFGSVHEARWTKPDGHTMLVAVKTLDTASHTSREQPQLHARFIKEANILHQVSCHPHIIQLLGIVLDRLMIVQELAQFGSLLTGLRQRPMPFSILQLCSFARQMASAMCFLEKKRLIHRDLAARNVLLTDKHTVKLSDFGLSRIIEQHGVMVSQSAALPIAWTAPEAVTQNFFSHKSDVWSFGVTLWEMLSQGARPYPNKSVYEIIKCIQPPDCYRLERPRHCPVTIYKIMQDCWEENPEKRPSFDELEKMIRAYTPPQAVVTRSQEQNREREEIALRNGELVTILDTSLADRWIGQNALLNIGALKSSCVRMIEPPEPDILPSRASIDPQNRFTTNQQSFSSEGSSDGTYINMRPASDQSKSSDDDGYAILRKLEGLPVSASSSSSSRPSVGTPGTSGSAVSSSPLDQTDCHYGSPRSTAIGGSGHSNDQAECRPSVGNGLSNRWEPADLLLEHNGAVHSPGSSAGSHMSSAANLLHTDPPNPHLLPPPLLCSNSPATMTNSPPVASAPLQNGAHSSQGRVVIPTRKVSAREAVSHSRSGPNSPEVQRSSQTAGAHMPQPPPGPSSAISHELTAMATSTQAPVSTGPSQEAGNQQSEQASQSRPNMAPLEEGSAQVARLKLLVPDKTDEECRRALIATEWSVEAAFRFICVNELMALSLPSISEHQCVRALDHCNWKVDRAAEWLIQLSIDS